MEFGDWIIVACGFVGVAFSFGVGWIFGYGNCDRHHKRLRK